MCSEFEPSATENQLCRAMKHVKSDVTQNSRHGVEGKFEMGTFRSENEYLSHHSKTIIITWRLLLVYINITPPHYTLASDLVNRQTKDTIFEASV
ncbi:hypothetical protein TNCV_2443021 [Trichonephila clavipes]|nr:hypothetical protein TNCV_2443021 [Trichonephila clavipes]